MNQSCIFCKIIARELPAKVIAETDNILVVEDIAPKAPIHYLIIPKKHIKDITSLSETDAFIPAYIMLMARDLSKRLSGSQSFRLIANNGTDAGQTVFHLHFHFISGKKLVDF